MRVAIIINLTANNGRAKKRWEKIKDEVLNLFPADTILVPFEPPFDIESCLQELIEKQKVNIIISAGGDGSANYILNALMKLENINLKDITLGGIGLGSSNDFIKPKKQFIQNIPVRLNFENKKLVDVGQLNYIQEDNQKVTRYFIANSSMGVTAEANYLFNQNNGLVGFLKNKLTDLAIIYVALKTIFTFKNYLIEIEYNDQIESMQISNLAVLKNPHVSGNFLYDQNIQLDDGQLGLNICENMSKWQLVKTLIDLSKGTFSGKQKRHSVFTKDIRIITSGFKALELDGEVVKGKHPHFLVLPKTINLLGT